MKGMTYLNRLKLSLNVRKAIYNMLLTKIQGDVGYSTDTEGVFVQIKPAGLCPTPCDSLKLLPNGAATSNRHMA